MFSRSGNSTKQFFIMFDASGRQKSKIATHQQEILMFVSRYLEFLTYRASYTIKNSSYEFFVLENMGIAVGILQLRYIQVEM